MMKTAVVFWLAVLAGISSAWADGPCCTEKEGCLIEPDFVLCGNLYPDAIWGGGGLTCDDNDGNGVVDACENHPKIYWVEPETNRILKSNLDGTLLATFFQGYTGTAFTANVVAIAVDRRDGFIYWREDRGDITRVKFNGANEQTVLGGYGIPDAATVSGPGILVIDPVERMIYWNSSTAGGIWRMGLEIPDGENFLHRSDVEQVQPGSNTPPSFIIVRGKTCSEQPVDSDHDGDTDLADYAVWQNCFTGPK